MDWLEYVRVNNLVSRFISDDELIKVKCPHDFHPEAPDANSCDFDCSCSDCWHEEI